MSRWIYVAVTLLAVGVAAPAFAQDVHVGTWKQNLAKSKADPAATTPAPRSATRKYEVFGDGLKSVAETVSADGKSNTITYSAHFDGKDSPYVGAANADTVALKRIDASTFEATLKKAGKVVVTARNMVSPDGKTMTITQKGTNAQGQPFTSTAVYEKQ